jgi:hypothetical protein
MRLTLPLSGPVVERGDVWRKLVSHGGDLPMRVDDEERLS